MAALTAPGTVVVMLELSEGMQEGTVLQWLVADGAEVTAGQPIVEVESDKATTELEATADGSLGSSCPRAPPWRSGASWRGSAPTVPRPRLTRRRPTGRRRSPNPTDGARSRPRSRGGWRASSASISRR